MKAKRATLETVISEFLAQYPENQEFEVIAHELWGNAREGFEANSSWYLSRHADKAQVLSDARGRWEVFKVNYAPSGRVKDISDASYSGPEFGCLLECNQVPFLDIRPVNS